jgi:hypothetical protein
MRPPALPARGTVRSTLVGFVWQVLCTANKKRLWAVDLLI